VSATALAEGTSRGPFTAGASPVDSVVGAEAPASAARAAGTAGSGGEGVDAGVGAGALTGAIAGVGADTGVGAGVRTGASAPRESAEDAAGRSAVATCTAAELVADVPLLLEAAGHGAGLGISAANVGPAIGGSVAAQASVSSSARSESCKGSPVPAAALSPLGGASRTVGSIASAISSCASRIVASAGGAEAGGGGRRDGGARGGGREPCGAGGTGGRFLSVDVAPTGCCDEIAATPDEEAMREDGGAATTTLMPSGTLDTVKCASGGSPVADTITSGMMTEELAGVDEDEAATGASAGRRVELLDVARRGRSAAGGQRASGGSGTARAGTERGGDEDGTGGEKAVKVSNRQGGCEQTRSW